ISGAPCPLTRQLLRNSGDDSGPDLSFNKSASLERLFSLAHVSLAEASKPDVACFLSTYFLCYVKNTLFSKLSFLFSVAAYFALDCGPLRGLYLCRVVLRYRCAKKELITLDLTCPSTRQLIRNYSGDSGPDLSFDKSASLERLFSLAHVSLTKSSNSGLSFRCSGGDYTSSTPKVQESNDRFFGRNISPPGGNRSSSNYGKGRKK
ncbi:hypothetical protein Tco_0022764, partial [Tanacetum coccineum]